MDTNAKQIYFGDPYLESHIAKQKTMGPRTTIRNSWANTTKRLNNRPKKEKIHKLQKHRNGQYTRIEYVHNIQNTYRAKNTNQTEEHKGKTKQKTQKWKTSEQGK